MQKINMLISLENSTAINIDEILKIVQVIQCYTDKYNQRIVPLDYEIKDGYVSMEQCADKTRPIILFKDYVEAEFPFCGVDLTWSYEKIMEFIKSKKNNYKKRIYYIGKENIRLKHFIYLII